MLAKDQFVEIMERLGNPGPSGIVVLDWDDAELLHYRLSNITAQIEAAVLAEREACAVIALRYNNGTACGITVPERVAAAIRARGETKCL